jgi:hypothetical protein
LTKNVFKVAVSGTILIVKSRLVKLIMRSCVTYDVNKVLKLHVNRFNCNSAEEEGGNRLAYQIASDELLGVSATGLGLWNRTEKLLKECGKSIK